MASSRIGVVALSQEPERVVVDNLERIGRVAAFTCKRYGMGHEDADECRAWIMLRLVEDDYRMLRKFRGESSVMTYLTVVITMLVRDYRVERWGRWRPSAAALRLGPAATRLEVLVFRDGMRLDHAIEQMRSASEVVPSERELRKLFAKLPVRAPLRPQQADEHAMLELAHSATAEDDIVQQERSAESQSIEELIADELQRLSAEDRVLLRMTFFDGLSVADVARGLGIPQKPLYRQIERLKRDLRDRLQVVGVTRERVVAFLSEVTS